MNLVAGIRNVDCKLVEVGTMYGFSRYELIRKIFIPAAALSVYRIAQRPVDGVAVRSRGRVAGCRV